MTTTMPVLPEAAVTEIMTSLAEKQRINSDEIAAILKKHEVTGNTEALQDSYRKRLGQRLMAAMSPSPQKRTEKQMKKRNKNKIKMSKVD